ncbi:MAG: NUDIX domain-containing protein [Flavobacteriaceae bacterium]|nr:NUDIX domain-containing protein [Flavobacteriaceae bacterium]
MYKISVNGKPFTIGKKRIKGIISFPYSNKDTFKTALDILYNTPLDKVHVYSSDIKEVWKKFQKLVTPVYAAGGIVKNKDGKYLFIKRNGVWDLPKGHVEEKETFEETAVREVEEECSVQGIKLKKPLSTTYHVYLDEQGYRLKVVKWFKMGYSGDENPQPQTEENIELAGWFSEDEIPELMENTYENIRELVFRYVLK